MAQADVLEDTQTTDAGDHDRFAHYFHKKDLDAVWLDGQEITAVCGKKDLPTRDPNKFPVCPTCKEIVHALPPA